MRQRKKVIPTHLYLWLFFGKIDRRYTGNAGDGCGIWATETLPSSSPHVNQFQLKRKFNTLKNVWKEKKNNNNNNNKKKDIILQSPVTQLPIHDVNAISVIVRKPLTTIWETSFSPDGSGDNVPNW